MKRAGVDFPGNSYVSVEYTLAGSGGLSLSLAASKRRTAAGDGDGRCGWCLVLGSRY